MSVTDGFKAKRIAAVIGPAHSPLIPDALWMGWLDSAGDLVAMAARTAPHAAFEIVGDTVTNTAAIDAGLAPAAPSTITAVGLFDAPADGMLVVPAIPVTFTDTVVEGDALAFAPGALVLTALVP